MLAAPSFHHLHLNSVDPDAAIDFYTRQFPPTTRARWGDRSVLASPNDVLVLFTKVAAAPATSPQAHNIPRCIDWVSSIHALEPGDVLATGTNHRGLSAFQDYMS